MTTFTVKVETTVSKYQNYPAKTEIKASGEFKDKKEANKFKRELIKKFGLVNHGGYLVNYSKGIELTKNY